jgi:hypothetical protein
MRRARSHIVERPPPSSTWISNAAVFQVPRRQSLPGYRFAQMPDFGQAVTRAPVAAMDHDGHWIRTALRWHPQLAELRFTTTVCDSRARWRGRHIPDASEHVDHTFLRSENIIESSVSTHNVSLSNYRCKRRTNRKRLKRQKKESGKLPVDLVKLAKVAISPVS